MGMGYDEFWQMTPRKLKVYIEGFKLKRQIEDENSWLVGGYMFNAVTLALGNAFRKKGTNAEGYFEVFDKPFLMMKNDEELTEEDKQKYIDQFMASLHVMQKNYEATHKG